MKRLWKYLRRRHRILVPLAVFTVLLVATLIAHAGQRVDVTDPNYLNPSSTAPDGGATLAARLRAAGVDVRPVGSGQGVYDAARNGGATVFVPAPDLLLPLTLAQLSALPESTVVVLVAPGDAAVREATGLSVARRRWATRTADPGCRLPAAVTAGPAGVDGVDYTSADADVTSCYDGGLVAVTSGPRWVVAGASDPFRNDRIGEDGNAALATALLSGTGTVVWLDMHTAEQEPQVTGVPPSSPVTSAPSQGTDTPDTNNDQTDAPPGTGDNTSNQNQGDGTRSGLGALFPGWLWATIGLVALVGLVLAVAAARRLGPPVAEPLPVTARARESLEGRGRLYKQARQPAAALNVLRASAMTHLPALLGLPRTTPTQALIEAVAAHTGYPPETVSAILVDDVPDKHADLVAAVDRLDDMMWALHPGHPEAAGHPEAIGEPR